MILRLLPLLWLLSLLCRPAAATQQYTVHTGQTFESIGGSPEAADALRARNGYRPGAQPLPGDVLILPDGEEGHGLIIHLNGTGTVTTPAGAALPLRVDLRLEIGSRVCTDADSYTTLRLAVAEEGTDHDEVTLLGQTCLVLSSAAHRGADRSSTLDLEQGGVMVPPTTTGPGAVTVRTPDGLTSAKAGGFRVSREEAATRTEALTAPLSVFGAGVEVPLKAGQGSRVRRGFAPDDPNALPSPGSPLAPVNGSYLRRPDFTWSAVPDVIGYRLEIAADPRFENIVWMKILTDPIWSPDRFSLPFRVEGLWWRVLSIDRLGFYGTTSEIWQVMLPEGIGP